MHSIAPFKHLHVIKNSLNFLKVTENTPVVFRGLAKDIKFGSEVRTVLMKGIDTLTDAVAVTMGPKGRNVILQEASAKCPKITKDGVTVAKNINLKDKFQDVGVKLFQDIACRTNTNAGDGTTTATVLARSIAKEGAKNIARGLRAIEIKRGVSLAVDKVIQTLHQMSRPVVSPEEIANVAIIASNGDRSIGQLIASAFEKVGLDGVITIKEGKRNEDSLTIINGYSFDKGYLSNSFINDKRGTKIEYNNCLILFTTEKLSSITQVIPALEIAHTQNRPLLIIAADIVGQAIAALVINRKLTGLEVTPVKAPEFGDIMKDVLEDMAIVTGGRVFSDETGANLKKIKPNELGEAEGVVISKDRTIILKGKGKQAHIEERQKMIRSLVETTEETERKEKLKTRLASLGKGIAVLNIGGSSEVEIKDKADRVTDALFATRAAIEEGILPGGGVALLRSAQKLSELKPENEEQRIGIEMVADALKAPMTTILNNAGKEAIVIIDKIMSSPDSTGYDVMTDKYVDMIESGIIDPTKVVCSALRDAAGVSSLLATVEAVITDRQ